MNKLIDWDDAYDNRKYTPNIEQYIDNWPRQAAKFRQSLLAENRAELDIAYGERTREKMDIFYPTQQPPKGLAIYIHGGYWMKFDKSNWSHFAAGALAHGYAVAIPSYDLAPNVTVGKIVAQIASAINHAASLISGDIYLAGHSAGGQIVTRMMCQDSALNENLKQRIQSAIGISGVYDLRPLLYTELNDILKLDEAQAIAQSPALLRPRPGINMTFVAGGAERDEFIRQNILITNIWHGLGIDTKCISDPDKNHFSIVEPLQDKNSMITRAFLNL